MVTRYNGGQTSIIISLHHLQRGYPPSVRSGEFDSLSPFCLSCLCPGLWRICLQAKQRAPVFSLKWNPDFFRFRLCLIYLTTKVPELPPHGGWTLRSSGSVRGAGNELFLEEMQGPGVPSSKANS